MDEIRKLAKDSKLSEQLKGIIRKRTEHHSDDIIIMSHSCFFADLVISHRSCILVAW